MKKSIYTVDQIDALLSGKGLAILGRYDSANEITDPVEGGHYYIGTEEPYDVYTYVNGAWVNAGPLAIPGPPGPAFTYDDFTPEQLDDLERGAKAAQAAAQYAASSAEASAASAEAARKEAKNYSKNPPVIGDNENWFVWSGEGYEDSGYSSRGAQGESGVTTPLNGFFTLAVDANGDLYSYSEDDIALEFEYDSASGNLYVVQEV